MNVLILRSAMLGVVLSLLCGCPSSDEPSGDEPVILIIPGDDLGATDMVVVPDASPEQDMSPDMPAPMLDMSSPDMSDMSPPVDLPVALDMPPDLPPDMATPKDMGPEIEAGPLTLATFNVELFFDTMCDTGDCGPESFERLPTAPELQQRYMTTGAAIDLLGADIIVLQEIEKENLFQTLVMGTQQNYTTMVFGETGRDASIDVAVAARGDLLEVKRHRSDDLTLPDGSTTRFARELLEVHVRIRGARVIVFGAHYISKFRPTNTPRRVAEAARTAELALEARQLHPDALILVAGDLNDTPDSETLAQFANAGLVLTSEGRDINDIYTNVFGFTLQAIDHILFVSTPGVSFDTAAGLEVFRDPGQVGLAGSDHAAARATFTFE